MAVVSRMCAFLAVHAGAGKHPYKTENLCREAICKSNGDIVEAIKVCFFFPEVLSVSFHSFSMKF